MFAVCPRLHTSPRSKLTDRGGGGGGGGYTNLGRVIEQYVMNNFQLKIFHYVTWPGCDAIIKGNCIIFEIKLYKVLCKTYANKS